jgi:hypothetical protein
LSIAPEAVGDLLYLKGGDAQIPALADGRHLLIEMPDGQIRLPLSLVWKRIPGFWPKDEWTSRRDATAATAVEARYANIWWAIENGLTIEVADEIRALHKQDPDNAPTTRLARALDRLDQPCAGGEFSRFQKALAIQTEVATGPHAILLHQHSEAEARERLDVLERVVRGFILMLAGQGIELPVPRQKMVSAWFADEHDYRAFLHSENADVFATTRGYYHPTWNAVVAYDARSNDQQKKPRDLLASKRDELRRYGALLDGAGGKARVKVKLGNEPLRTVSLTEARSLIERVKADVDCEAMLLDLDRRYVDLGTAAHEMIHQLSANTGFSPDHRAFPQWLGEGFAAQFEVIRGGRWSGISRAHDLRLPDWRKLSPPPKLERVIHDVGFGHGYNRDVYAQCWALVYFLRTQHTDKFLTYLDLLRNPDKRSSATEPRAAGAEHQLAVFQRAFGADLTALEKEWHRFMKTVKTPLEQHAPAPAPAAKAKSKAVS